MQLKNDLLTLIQWWLEQAKSKIASYVGLEPATPILMLGVLIFALLSLTALVSFILTWRSAATEFKNSTTPPITVSPSQIKSPPGWESNEKIRISNISDQDLYNVWIKFHSNENSYNWQNIKLTSPFEKRELIQISPNISMSGTTLKVVGEYEGVDYLYLRLDRIEAHQKIEFEITIHNDKSDQETYITPKLIGHTSNPVQKGKLPGSWQGFSINFPESIKVKAFLMNFDK